MTVATAWPAVAPHRQGVTIVAWLEHWWQIIMAALGMGGTAVGWWAGRRARAAEADKTGADAATTLVDGAGHLAEVVTAQLDRMAVAQAATDKRLESVTAELAEVQDRRRTLEAQVMRQDNQLTMLGDSLHRLRSDHEQQRQLLTRVLVVGREWMTVHTTRLEAIGGTADPWPSEFIDTTIGGGDDASTAGVGAE